MAPSFDLLMFMDHQLTSPETYSLFNFNNPNQLWAVLGLFVEILTSHFQIKKGQIHLTIGKYAIIQGINFWYLSHWYSTERETLYMVQCTKWSVIDRFLISTEWLRQFPNTSQIALHNTSSDHCLLLCTIKPSFAVSNFFFFENFYLKIPEFTQLVHQTWLSLPTAANPQELNQKFQNLAKEISRWSKERVDNIKTQIKAAR
jgi:hypothetical protein